RKVFVNAYDRGNTFNVQSLGSGVQFTIKAGAGGDVVNIGDTQHNLMALAGSLTVNGTGNTTLEVDDRGNKQTPAFLPVATFYDVENGRLTRTAYAYVNGVLQLPPFFADVSYGGLARLTIDGGAVGVYQYQINGTGGTGSGGVVIKAISPR